MSHRLPPLLIACSLLFWGSMVDGRLPFAVAIVLLLLGAKWSRLRWDFGERAALVAWRLSVLFLTIAMVLETMGPQPRITTMARVFMWLPVLLLPLQFVQTYGMSDTITLGTFSMMIRRRRQHAQKHGLPFREIRFNFDNVYLCATLLSASLGGLRGGEKTWFYPCLLILVGWAVAARQGWKSVGIATLVAWSVAGC
jgi:protein-glutamine gamma-glutamyltransferase